MFIALKLISRYYWVYTFFCAYARRFSISECCILFKIGCSRFVSACEFVKCVDWIGSIFVLLWSNIAWQCRRAPCTSPRQWPTSSSLTTSDGTAPSATFHGVWQAVWTGQCVCVLDYVLWAAHFSSLVSNTSVINKFEVINYVFVQLRLLDSCLKL